MAYTWWAAVTIGRVYSDRATREQYKAIFDGFQTWIKALTDKLLLFKRLSKNGTLIYVQVGFEAAQVLGCSDSFLSTNEPGHSGIENDVAIDEFVQYFIHGCYAHAKRWPIILSLLS